MSTEHLQTKEPLLSYDEWKKELEALIAKEAGMAITSVTLNDVEARPWWEQGFTPYATFRETWGVEDDGI